MDRIAQLLNNAELMALKSLQTTIIESGCNATQEQMHGAIDTALEEAFSYMIEHDLRACLVRKLHRAVTTRYEEACEKVNIGMGMEASIAEKHGLIIDDHTKEGLLKRALRMTELEIQVNNSGSDTEEDRKLVRDAWLHPSVLPYVHEMDNKYGATSAIGNVLWSMFGDILRDNGE